mmetsp:Transcript_16456/g.47285  ORF Transcript_16456/g.47285 Transcript_16456/m.47285 type:complete len:131 (-) Transcript_16456:144-536(-)
MVWSMSTMAAYRVGIIGARTKRKHAALGGPREGRAGGVGNLKKMNESRSFVESEKSESAALRLVSLFFSGVFPDLLVRELAHGIKNRRLRVDGMKVRDLEWEYGRNNEKNRIAFFGMSHRRSTSRNAFPL